MGDAPLDRKVGHRRLPDGAAARENGFAPDRANDFERRSDPGELLGHVLAERPHLLAVVQTVLKHMTLTREVRR